MPEAGAPAITIFFGPAATATTARREEDAVTARALSARRCLAPVNWEAETVNAAADIVCVGVCPPIGSDSEDRDGRREPGATFCWR